MLYRDAISLYKSVLDKSVYVFSRESVKNLVRRPKLNEAIFRRNQIKAELVAHAAL